MTYVIKTNSDITCCDIGLWLSSVATLNLIIINLSIAEQCMKTVLYDKSVTSCAVVGRRWTHCVTYRHIMYQVNLYRCSV